MPASLSSKAEASLNQKAVKAFPAYQDYPPRPRNPHTASMAEGGFGAIW
jgi:hypothetical protein